MACGSKHQNTCICTNIFRLLSHMPCKKREKRMLEEIDIRSTETALNPSTLSIPKLAIKMYKFHWNFLPHEHW